MGVAALVTGGKDSVLALHYAQRMDYEVEFLVTMIPQREDSWMFHYPNIQWTKLLAEAIGIPLVQKETVLEEYEQEFKQTVQNLIPGGVKGMIFGDIYLLGHENWAERVCNELGIEAVAPLWGRSSEEILFSS